jgi:hypothetical protein
MVPYQIYQALMDEHVHELQAAARRHELHVAARRHNRATEARLAAAHRTERSSRLKGAVGYLAALVHARRGAGSTTARSMTARSTTSRSTAGPMGCVA